MENTCATCKYFIDNRSEYYDGRCFRFPPVPTYYEKRDNGTIGIEFGHPGTCDEYFCGEWRSKEIQEQK